MKIWMILLCCFLYLKGIAQIPIPPGFGCTARGFCKDSLYLTNGTLPKKQKALPALMKVMEAELNGDFHITKQNLVVGTGFNTVEQCYWFAAASLRDDRFIIAWTPRKSGAFRSLCDWMIIEAQTAAGHERKWVFVDAAGRYCTEGMLLRL